MKKSLLLFAIVALLISCKATNEPKNAKMVDVTVYVSGIDVTVTPENAPRRAPMASDKDANQASVKRIALSVYDLNGTLIESATQNKDVDATNFGTAITFRLPVGSYKFVAVAHTVANTADPVATINSVSEISFGAAIVGNPTYTTVQDVTIAGNTTQAVVVDMGTRKNATFAAKFTDDSPADVTDMEIIVSPASTAYTDLKVDPSTGFAASQWQYKKSFNLASFGKTTVKGATLNVPLMLTGANTQQLDVTINALDQNGAVLYTRTLENVTLQQAHKTLATGTFFSPEATSTFTFDITEITDNISLD